MRKPGRSLHTTIHKSSQPEVFSIEIEHLLDVFARIEVRRQLRLRALELERKSVRATPEKSS